MEFSRKNDILTVAQAAALLKMHAGTVRRKAKEGTLPGKYVGHWRFSYQQLLEWIEDNTYQGIKNAIRRAALGS